MHKNVSMYEIGVAFAGELEAIGTSGLNPCVGVFLHRQADEFAPRAVLTACHVPEKINIEATLGLMTYNLVSDKHPERIKAYLVSGNISNNSTLERIKDELAKMGIEDVQVIREEKFAVDVETGQIMAYQKDDEDYKNVVMSQNLIYQNPPPSAKIVFNYDGKNKGPKASLGLAIASSIVDSSRLIVQSMDSKEVPQNFMRVQRPKSEPPIDIPF